MNAITQHIENLKVKAIVLPNTPGVYQYFDETGTIIYVGKAKDLKKRVMSYFTGYERTHAKTKILVKNIAEIKYMVVETEEDALLLENNLIKKYQPRYNVLLKDDKNFPWICVKQEPFPRIFITRKVENDGSQYFGPYASMYLAKTTYSLVRKLYQLRTCNLNLNPTHIAQKKYKVCLEYHINNCLAPCVGKQPEEEYNTHIDLIKEILKGNLSSLCRRLKQMMTDYAERLEFENAHKVKEQLAILEKYRAKSTIVSQTLTDIDVYSLWDADPKIYINYLRIKDGAIIQTHTLSLKRKLEESREELLATGIIELRKRFRSNAKEILVPFIPDMSLESATLRVPKIGDKKKLLDLSERNVKYYHLEQEKRQHKQETPTDKLLGEMKKTLRLPEAPVRMECFDNSNIQGTNPVASCVVFKNGKPFRSAYRHFHIKTVEGANDFASMKEVVYRRYKRLLDEEKDLPHLVVIDGGKGQLSAAVEALDELNLRHKLPIISIAKRLEEIYFPGDSLPIYIDKKSPSLKVLQRIRDEAHRFAISFHRAKRSDKMTGSELENIAGVGKSSIEKLYNHFKTRSAIKNASLDELTQVIPLHIAKKVEDYFRETQATNSS